MPQIKFYYNKYKNKSCRCSSGHIHDSRGEAGYCDSLLLLKKAGEIKDFYTQKTFELRVNGVLITRHRVDFWVINKSGSTEVHEFKGFETDVWIIKKRLFEATNPDIPYIVVKGK